MESNWDTVETVIVAIVVLILLVRLVLHFIRPVTWRDGEGPIISEEGGGGLPLPGWSANFWATLLYYLLPWRR